MNQFPPRTETRTTCPVCAYPLAYSETVGRNGQRVGYCWSCHDQAAIATILGGDGGDRRHQKVTPQPAAADAAAQALKSLERARAAFGGASVITPESPAGLCLALRGLKSQIGNPELRWRTDLSHPTGGKYIGLVERVQDVAGNLIAVQRLYLRPDGTKADLEPVRATLASVMGGFIKIGDIGPEMVVGEGLESSASAGLLLGLPPLAAVTAGNLASTMQLPSEVRKVTIFADHDAPGIRAAKAAKARWRAEGREVKILKANEPGKDANDILMGRLNAAEGTKCST